MIRPDGWTELYGRSWSPVVADGITSPAPELMIHLAAFSNLYAHPELDSPLVREQAFRSIVDHLWGKESRFEFIWHPWADEMLKLACSQRYLGVAGCASCVSGDTEMLDPITGGKPTIKSLCDNDIQPWVMTLNGPLSAGRPAASLAPGPVKNPGEVMKSTLFTNFILS